MCLHQVLKHVTVPGADSSVHRHRQEWGPAVPGSAPWAHFRGVHGTLPALSRELSFSNHPLHLLSAQEGNKQACQQVPPGP